MMTNRRKHPLHHFRSRDDLAARDFACDKCAHGGTSEHLPHKTEYISQGDAAAFLGPHHDVEHLIWTCGACGYKWTTDCWNPES